MGGHVVLIIVTNAIIAALSAGDTKQSTQDFVYTGTKQKAGSSNLSARTTRSHTRRS
jgi:hypothetical protein